LDEHLAANGPVEADAGAGDAANGGASSAAPTTGDAPTYGSSSSEAPGSDGA
jgi:hypothetical protein